jgi:hypothetical protein
MNGERAPLGTESSTRCRCGNSLPARHPKYCTGCSPKASLLWKREQRRLNRGTGYWLDHWLKLTGDEQAAREAYNAYMAAYMRRRRAQLKRRNRTLAHIARTPKQNSYFSETHAGGYAQ